MRNTITIASLLLVLALVSGCDFFRKVAGRPTSEEIRAKTEAMAKVAEEHQARELEAKEKAVRDSLAKVSYTIDSLAAREALKGEKVMGPRGSGGLKDGVLCSKYCIIVGSFSNRTNAERLGKEISDKGYSMELVQFKNGYTAVGLCGTDDIVRIVRSLEEVRRQDFCPKGVWILANE